MKKFCDANGEVGYRDALSHMRVCEATGELWRDNASELQENNLNFFCFDFLFGNLNIVSFLPQPQSVAVPTIEAHGMFQMCLNNFVRIRSL